MERQRNTNINCRPGHINKTVVVHKGVWCGNVSSSFVEL